MRREDFFVSATPILSPHMGGRAFMVNPKVLVAMFVQWLTGESHPEDCHCEVCNYKRLGEEQMAIVDAQRTKMRSTAVQAKEYVCGPRNDVPDEVVAYWDNYFLTHYPMTYSACEDRYGQNFLYYAIDRDPERDPADILLEFMMELGIDDFGWSSSDVSHWTESYADFEGGLHPLRIVQTLCLDQ